jgi:hypothetical protein
MIFYTSGGIGASITSGILCFIMAAFPIFTFIFLKKNS